jgi:hypothetical protein
MSDKLSRAQSLAGTFNGLVRRIAEEEKLHGMDHQNLAILANELIRVLESLEEDMQPAAKGQRRKPT